MRQLTVKMRWPVCTNQALCKHEIHIHSVNTEISRLTCFNSRACPVLPNTHVQFPIVDICWVSAWCWACATCLNILLHLILPVILESNNTFWICPFYGKDISLEWERLSDLSNSVAELIRTSQSPKGSDLNRTSQTIIYIQIYLGVMLKCRFWISRSAVGSENSSNKFPGDANIAGLRTPLRELLS